ncbi:hypothetical protein GCM10027089_08520 [Nocardia thraciensis]
MKAHFIQCDVESEEDARRQVAREHPPQRLAVRGGGLDRALSATPQIGHFVAWSGPIGNSLPRKEIEFDVRPGGNQRSSESPRPIQLDAALIGTQTPPSSVEV